MTKQISAVYNDRNEYAPFIKAMERKLGTTNLYRIGMSCTVPDMGEWFVNKYRNFSVQYLNEGMNELSLSAPAFFVNQFPYPISLTEGMKSELIDYANGYIVSEQMNTLIASFVVYLFCKYELFN